MHKEKVGEKCEAVCGLIEKTGKKVFDKETGASAGTYRIVEV